MNDTPWQQIELPLMRTADEPDTCPDRMEAHRRRIAGYLTVRLPEPVEVAFTNNRSTMLSFRQKKGRLHVRLHHLFHHADDVVLEMLARYIARKDKAASRVIDAFIAAHRKEIRHSARRCSRVLRSQGKHHDLASIRDDVNSSYFEGKAAVDIGWARAPARRRRRRRSRTISRALATYDYEDRTIRVSPVLDSEDVPGYVLEWIVYHEMLHHVLPVEKSGGRRLYHSPKFRALERAFRRYEDAKAWENKNLDRLLE